MNAHWTLLSKKCPHKNVKNLKSAPGTYQIIYGNSLFYLLRQDLAFKKVDFKKRRHETF